MSVHNAVNINPLAWYGVRELNFKPRHFVVATTELTTESLNWIAHTLVGRYAIVSKPLTEYLDILSRTRSYISTDVPAFEDPTEATLYELTWS